MKSIQQLQDTIHYQFQNQSFGDCPAHSLRRARSSIGSKYNRRQEFWATQFLYRDSLLLHQETCMKKRLRYL